MAVRFIDAMEDEHLEKRTSPLYLSGKQSDIVNDLLESLTKVIDALEPLGLTFKEISLSNDLFDQVAVSIGIEPDGDHQNSLFDAGDFMTYEDIISSLKTRISNMLESVA